MLALTVSTVSIEQELHRDPRIVSEHTRRGYRSDLNSFESWRGSQPMTRGLVESYASELRSQGVSPSTINRKLSAIRWWTKRLLELAHDGNLPKEQVERIQTHAQRVMGVKGVRGNHVRVGKHIPDSEIRAALDSLSNMGVGLVVARDAALLSLAWSAGLRRAEIASLSLEDLTIGECIEIRVLGKGDKVRTAYLYGMAMKALLKWLKVRGSEPGPVFCRIRRDNRLDLTDSLSGEGMAHILSRRLEGYTWHDFRRTCAGNLLDKGVDLVTVQKILGHSSPSTTANYDRRGERAQRMAAQMQEFENAY